ncbi:MAG: Copper amine oxidase N-terminal domain [Chthonomonadales bacterium]|nr:Copper amine oxidase N-terminal domain [Chthonomonadales bacterium]
MMKRMACALALAAGTGLTLGVATHTALAQPTPATAVSGLKLSVAPLGSVTADTPVALDVNFRGGKVRSVEVYLDGTRIAKETLDTLDTHGVIKFNLPASLLAEGSHEITIQAVDKDGSTASTTTRVRVNAPAQDALAHFMTPKRNALVKEFAPIEVKLDENIKDAYVMFFLDGQFLSARNYSPYIYSLDTQKFANGDHTIKIEVWDSTGASVLKTLSMPVKINNSGGFSKLQPDTRNLNDPAGLGKTDNPNLPEAALPFATLDPQSVSGLAHSPATARRNVGVGNGVEPRTVYTGSKSTLILPGIPNPGTINADRDLANPNSDLARTVNGNPSTLRGSGTTPPTHFANGDNHAPIQVTPQPILNSTFSGVLADPSDLNALNSETGRVARQTTNVRRAGNVAARPSMTLDGTSAPTIAHPTHTAPVPAIKLDGMRRIAQAPRAYVGSRSMHNTHVKTFDVAFDNTQIAFDVPPRIENGMPLAPFRAIFEHSGGTVKWYGESKTVRAINNSKEIEIHIGDKEAMVNNEKVKLDAKAYIDRGRTIVPLSFVKDAMDVKVTYDAKTGHVLIESNK